MSPKDMTQAERAELREKLFHDFIKRNLRKRIRSPRIEDFLLEGPDEFTVVKPTAHTREGFAFRHPKLGLLSRRWESMRPAEIMIAMNEEEGYVCPKCGAWEYRGGDAEHQGVCGRCPDGRWIWCHPVDLD